MRFPTSLFLKGITKPHRIPGFLSKNIVTPFINRNSYRVHKYRARVPDQRDRVADFLDQDEYAVVVLDACRYDVFERVYTDFLDGELEKVWSPANKTPIWAPKMWPDTYDCTYVSTTPYISRYEYEQFGYRYCGDEHFDRVVEAWDFGWDHDLRTTPPDVVTDATLEIAATSEQTRVVAHYMQPHTPFIGDYRPGAAYQELPDASGDVTPSERREFLENASEVTKEEMVGYEISGGDAKRYDIDLPSLKSTYTLFEEGEITVDQVRRAYRSNLTTALEEVVRLVERLDCPVAVTADHGDLLGENGRTGHQRTELVAHPALREVPWFVVNEEYIGTTDNDVEESVIESGQTPTEEVKEKLSHLGYT